MHDIQVGGHFINGLGVGRIGCGEGRSVGVLDVMGVLVLGLVAFDGCASFSSRMIPGGASDFVADETFVILDVFCPLDQGKVDPVDVHSHRIPRVFSGSCRGGDVVSPSS